jgi:hypothetical protein
MVLKPQTGIREHPVGFIEKTHLLLRIRLSTHIGVIEPS